MTKQATMRAYLPKSVSGVSPKTHPDIFAKSEPLWVKSFFEDIESLVGQDRMQKSIGDFLTADINAQGLAISVLASRTKVNGRRNVVAIEVYYQGTHVCSASRVGSKLTIRHFKWLKHWQPAVREMLAWVANVGCPQKTIVAKRSFQITDEFLESLEKIETEPDDDGDDDEEVADDE